ncbi:MAG TPA: hypothetical protein VFR97_00990 [Capillimicrobium sp.]|nr:hypothetical protein [Capillimicrobium sp.]
MTGSDELPADAVAALAGGYVAPERTARLARALRALAPGIAATGTRIAALRAVEPVVVFSHADARGQAGSREP